MTSRSLADIPILCCLLAGCTATQPDRPVSPFELRFDPITSDITLAYRPDMPRFPVIGNAVIVPVDGGVVLIDGGGAAAVADQILAHLRANGLGPILYLVLSHWHSDHTVGIDRYLATYPDARIVSHPWTRERIVTRLVERVSGFAENVERQMETARAELETGTSSETTQPLSAMQRVRAEQLIADYPKIHEQYLLASTAVPDLSTQGMTLPVNGRRIELHSLGCGNTPGDLVVWLPEERVLISGDILTMPVPFGFPPCTSEVITATERLLAFDFDYLVLGHGAVQRDRVYGEKALALQRHAVAEISRLHTLGLTADEIAAQLDLSPYDREITGEDPALEYFFDIWYRQPITARAVREIEAGN